VVIAVADHEPVPVLVDPIGELLDVGGDFGLQRGGEYLPGTVTDDLVEQRPTSDDVILVGRFLVVNYLEHGRTFPTSVGPLVLIKYLEP
jgi:hypothetical protein